MHARSKERNMSWLIEDHRAMAWIKIWWWEEAPFFVVNRFLKYFIFAPNITKILTNDQKNPRPLDFSLTCMKGMIFFRNYALRALKSPNFQKGRWFLIISKCHQCNAYFYVFHHMLIINRILSRIPIRKNTGFSSFFSIINLIIFRNRSGMYAKIETRHFCILIGLAELNFKWQPRFLCFF